jgi:hypothetical protein
MATPTTEPLAPLDLSFLADWDFVNGVGKYSAKQACVMSAASRLCVSLAVWT